MADNKVHLIAHYQVKPGEIDRLLPLLEQPAAARRKEDGNYYYEFFRSMSDSDPTVIVETYADGESVDAHRKSQHFAEIGKAQVIPLLAKREVHSYQALS